MYTHRAFARIYCDHHKEHTKSRPNDIPNVMTSSPAGNDVEEAKVEVEYDEPTDERDTKDTSTGNISRTAGTSSNPNAAVVGMDVSENPALVEDVVPEDDRNNDETEKVKQIQMTVAADAPWTDRLWEGMFCCSLCITSLSSFYGFAQHCIIFTIKIFFE